MDTNDVLTNHWRAAAATVALLALGCANVEGSDEPISSTTQALTTSNYTTGSFTIQYRECDWSTTDDRNSQTAYCAVDPEYVLIGGGALTSKELTSPGVLLTASYPYSSSTWSASSKDHHVVATHKLKAYAIGIKHASWTRDTLNGYIVQRQDTNPTDMSAPMAVAVCDSVYGEQIIGGGAKVQTDQQLLVYSYPPLHDYEGAPSTMWVAGSKDHIYSAPGHVTAYALCAKSELLAALAVATTLSGYATAAPGYTTQYGGDDLSGWYTASMGAYNYYRGAGRLLTSLVPSPVTGSSRARTKDHSISDSGYTGSLAVFSVAIKAK